MAIAKVRDFTTINSAFANTHDFSTPAAGCAAGNLVVVRAVINSDSVTYTSVTDAQSNTYALDVQLPSGGSNNSVLIASSILSAPLVSGDFVRITVSAGGAALGGHAAEFSGIAASPLDKVASQVNGYGTPWTSGVTAATTQADELLIGIASSNSDIRSTPSGSWNEETDANYASPGRSMVTQYQIVAATGTYEANGTWASSEADPAGIATYKGASAAVGDPNISSFPRRGMALAS